MKRKDSELVVGQEYYFDSVNDAFGVYLGKDDRGKDCFKPIVNHVYGTEYIEEFGCDVVPFTSDFGFYYTRKNSKSTDE